MGTMVVLEVDTSFCTRDSHMNCFSDVVSVANYLGAAAAKQVSWNTLILDYCN